MLENERLCFWIEAKVRHRDKRDNRADGENYVKREYITEESVHNYRDCVSANCRRIEEACNSASVFLGYSQHKRGVKDHICRRIHKSANKCKNTYKHEIVG